MEENLINFILNLISKGGMIMLLTIITVALVYWIITKTVPKELYDEQREDINEIKTELRELVAPTFDMMGQILDRQDRINNEFIRQMDNQTRHMSEISKDLRDATYELRKQRDQKHRLSPGYSSSEEKD